MCVCVCVCVCVCLCAQFSVSHVYRCVYIYVCVHLEALAGYMMNPLIITYNGSSHKTKMCAARYSHYGRKQIVFVYL